MIVEFFAHPEWWPALTGLGGFVVVALGVARWVARRRRTRLLGSPAWISVGSLRSDIALLFAGVAIAIALLGIRFGEHVLRVPATGVDVVFAVDVSQSMDARDVPPSRLSRAQRGVEELLDRLGPFDRSALVAFAGRGVLLAPLTPDRDALRELLTALDTELLRPRGSHLATGVNAALEAFEQGSERPRVVFLMSDGEDPERRSNLGADAASRKETRILAAAFGTEAGATVPDHGVPLVDRTGSVVVSRRERERLDSLVRATDGELFVADRWGAFDFDAASASIHRDTGAAPGEWVERRVRAVQVFPFALVAFGLLLFEGLPASVLQIRLRRRRGRRRWPAAVALLAIAASPGDEATLESLEAELRANPADARLLNSLGIARLERGKRREAVRAFLGSAVAAEGRPEAATPTYNLGVARLEQGDLEAARDAFFDALALDPDDERARFNLEWTVRALAVEPPEPEDGPDESPPAPEPPPADEGESTSAETPNPEEIGARPAQHRELDAATRQRLLDRIEDDPGRALQSATREERSKRADRGVPRW